MPARLDERRPNGFELSRPAAQATVDSLSRILAGNEPTNFPHASRVSCSELLGRSFIRKRTDVISEMCKTPLKGAPLIGNREADPCQANEAPRPCAGA
jgi:hypothetical protein